MLNSAWHSYSDYSAPSLTGKMQNHELGFDSMHSIMLLLGQTSPNADKIPSMQEVPVELLQV